MKKITDIYTDYKIMKNLQMHQLRVAAVAFQICDSLNIEITDKDNILKACLLHDMGNIIKFHLDYFPEFSNPEGLEYWLKVQREYKEKYGEDEHRATVDIAKEIGVNSRIVELINSIDHHIIENTKNGLCFSKKICFYADNRVIPHGIVSIEDRNLEAKNRYKNHPHAFDEEMRSFYMENIREIEKQIFSHSKIKPEEINDESIVNYLEKLKFFEI